MAAQTLTFAALQKCDAMPGYPAAAGDVEDRRWPERDNIAPGEVSDAVMDDAGTVRDANAGAEVLPGGIVVGPVERVTEQVGLQYEPIESERSASRVGPGKPE